MPLEPRTFVMYTEIFEILFEMQKCGIPRINLKPLEKVGRYTTNRNVETLTPNNSRWTQQIFTSTCPKLFNTSMFFNDKTCIMWCGRAKQYTNQNSETDY